MSSQERRWRGRVARAAAAIAVAAGAICAVYVASSFEWGAIWRVVSDGDVRWFLGGGVASLVGTFVARALRWKLLLRAVGVELPFLEIYIASVESFGVAVVTPLQSGEATKVELLKRRARLERRPAYLTLLAERVLDFAVIVTIAVAAVVFGFGGIEPPTAPLVAVGLAALVAGGAALVVAWLTRKRGRVAAALADLRALGRKRAALGMALSLTFVSWCFVAAGWYACLRSVSVDLASTAVLGFVAVLTIVNVASLVPGAVGVSEAGAAAFLAHLGHGRVQSQAGALAIRGYALLIIVWALLHGVAGRLPVVSAAARSPRRWRT